uniref:Uncharacterized protein n=1 Tax=Compsopogon caeruleus TaxID=31354 RepID=A0A7S1T8H8_9RHOD|mmetsp:Transcript_12970/g.26311  ORF Transcript_12970/g.26311 Transcript_12970/m.26311 type:complete len:343 (+) Transcript_12970:89-1117(+)
MGSFFIVIILVSVTVGFGARQWVTSSFQSPTARYENCAVAFKGRIVFLFGRNSVSLPVSVYDPSLDSWTELPRTPFRAHHLQCAVHKDGIIVGGGFGSGSFPKERPLNDVYLFKPNANIWTKVTTMPAGRSRGSCGLGVYRGKWYFTGGSLLGHAQGTSFTVDFFDEYNPSTNSWRVMPNLPTRRDHGGVAIVGDKLFLAGGQVGGARDFWVQHVQQIDVFDFQSETWTTIGSTRYPHGGVMPVAAGRTIIIAGGEYNNISSGETEFIRTSTMTILPRSVNMSAPGGRHGFQMASCGGRFYAGAGAISRKPKDIRLSTIERLDWSNTFPLCTGIQSYWRPQR